MIALALLLATQPIDPVAAAVVGLSPAEIEDDNGPDMPFLSIASAGCTVTLKGRDQTFQIDMAKATAVSLGDTFVFIEAAPVKLAIVGDASQPDQAAKLKALNAALIDMAKRCAPAR